jgi:polysaccharide export outer membrane protein
MYLLVKEAKKMNRIILVFGCLLLLFASCVPNRKYVYMQKDDLHRKDLPKDTILRSYNQVPFDYRIQPNDALYVRFQSLTPEEFDFFQAESSGGNAGGNQNLQLRSELVDPEGYIGFPVAGKVKVAGLTVFEIQDTLQAVANQFLKSPIVKVRLVNYRYTMLGEVKVEGTITTSNNRISLPEAIGLAGGLGDLADRSNIKIIRQKDGQTQVGYINLLDEHIMESPFYYVYQNDVVVVPALRQRPFRKYFSENVAVILSAATLVLLVVNLSN